MSNSSVSFYKDIDELKPGRDGVNTPESEMSRLGALSRPYEKNETDANPIYTQDSNHSLTEACILPLSPRKRISSHGVFDLASELESPNNISLNGPSTSNPPTTEYSLNEGDINRPTEYYSEVTTLSQISTPTNLSNRPRPLNDIRSYMTIPTRTSSLIEPTSSRPIINNPTTHFTRKDIRSYFLPHPPPIINDQRGHETSSISIVPSPLHTTVASTTQSTNPRKSKKKIYKVDYIIDHKLVQGEKLYLIKWRNYEVSEATWECSRDILDKSLISDYNKKLKNKEYVVESILNSRTNSRNQEEYLIRWKGFGSDQDSWVGEEDVKAQDLINDFKNKRAESNIKKGTIRIVNSLKIWSLNVQSALTWKFNEITAELKEKNCDIGVITETGVTPEICTSQATIKTVAENGYNLIPALVTDNKAGHIIIFVRKDIKIVSTKHHKESGRVLKVVIDIGEKFEVIGVYQGHSKKDKDKSRAIVNSWFNEFSNTIVIGDFNEIGGLLTKSK